MKPPLLFLLLTPIILFLSGCLGTPYQPFDEDHHIGYHIGKGPNRRFEITFIGNSRYEQKRVRDFAFLCSAEVTKKQGFSNFVIEDQCDVSTKGIRHDTIQTRPLAARTGDEGRMTQSQGGMSNALPMAESQIFQHITTTPAYRLTIRLISTEESTAPGLAIQNADKLIATLTAQYGLKL